jgi:hypothetical protein
MKHGQASSTRRGVRIIFGWTLDRLATRSMAETGRGAWETRHCEPLGAALLAGYPGFQTTKKDHGRVPIKLPTIPLCWSVLSLSLSSCVRLPNLAKHSDDRVALKLVLFENDKEASSAGT